MEAEKIKSENTSPGDELEILHPERELPLEAGSVTVNELTFIDGLKNHDLVTPLAQAIGDLLQDEDVSLEALMAVFSTHEASFVSLMSLSVNKTTDWIHGLNDSDGMALALSFWEVNRGFFVRRVLMHNQQASARAEIRAGSAPERSTQS